MIFMGLAVMGETERLVTMRREQVARCRALKGELTEAKRKITSLDTVLLMLDPNYKPEAGRTNRRGQARNGLFSRGEMTAAALAVLRDLNRPASSAECARAMLAAKGIDDDDPMQGQISTQVTALLWQKIGSGQVRRTANGDGRQVLWEIAR